MASTLPFHWVSSDLFPTKWSFVVFISYMALFINQGILITATKTSSNTYTYNTVMVVFITECLKLLVASSVYIYQNSFHQMIVDIFKYSKVLLLYFVPALLYCFYNNLAFTNLAVFDPTTYYLLLQFRVVVTGIIFQFLFKKKLSRMQWISLLLLTVGCIVKQMKSDSSSGNGTLPSFHLSFNLILILLQVFCSCFAGVYNEYLLKDTGADVDIMMQNVFMYLDSIVCNFGLLVFNGEFISVFTLQSLYSVGNYKVILIMLNNAGIGIVTSLFLKSLNSILKTFASALELMFTAVLCWIIFGIPIDYYTVIAIAIVSYATYLYSQNPVVNKAKNDSEVDLLAGTDGKPSKKPQVV